MPTTAPANRSETILATRIADRIGRRKYGMWFDHTTKLRVEGDQVDIAADNPFVAKWIDTHFAGELGEAARETLGDSAHINVRVAPHLFNRQTRSQPDQDDNLKPNRQPTSPARKPSRRTPSRRRLDDFIVGDSNRLAYDAAVRFSGEEGGSAKLLSIHGECGLGKTHLLQGICQRRRELAPTGDIRYTTGEQFTNEYIAALRSGSIETFRHRIRKLDLLVIDDVHFLSNKTATQNEFLHTIDAIDLSGARVVIATDEHPRHIRKFNQALVSRFLSGMVVEVDRPDRETRRTIIRHLAAMRSMTLSEGAESMLVGRFVGSVREIEGALTKLAALQLLSKDSLGGREQIGVVLVEKLLAEQSEFSGHPVRMATILQAVCEKLGVDHSEIISSGRHSRVVAARGITVHLAREMTTMSYPEIARSLGRDTHSTAHSAGKRIRNQIKAQQTIEIADQPRPVALTEFLDELRHYIRRIGIHGQQ